MYLQLIAWTLRRRPWRNVLIMASVALTVAVATMFFSMQFELSKLFARLDSIPFQRYWVKPRNLATHESYPIALRDQFAKVPGVAKVSYVLNADAQTADGTWLTIQGGADGMLPVEQDFFPVDDATIKRWDADPTSAVFADVGAEKLHAKVGDLVEIVLADGAGTLKLHVAGISYKGPFDTRVLLHYKYLDAVLGSKGVVDDYRIALDKATDPRPTVKAIDEILHQHGLMSHMVSARTMMSLRGANAAGLIPSLLGALGLVLLLTTAIAITNTAVISVRERRAELATLRVLGFKKRIVAALIVSEMFAVCLAGAAVGTGLAWFAMRNGLQLGENFMYSARMTMPGVLAGVGSCFVVAILGSSISAWIGVRSPLSVALREAG